ncbi:hypothetical protein PHET_03633 [Paragonimus heterotremus]|uniref:Uncharacterized protein n=1 Tax=Paragonimus heterotremus TaxID=100268 RepID=A0A8J4X199_9TREM|nr:hypothetical protein PHET_03633 [Paragonimus heterotremus]
MTGYAQCIRRFTIDDSVLARDFRGQNKWTPAVISKRTGKVIYEVTVGEKSGEDISTSYGGTMAYFRSNQTHHHYIGTFKLEKKTGVPLSIIRETTPGFFPLIPNEQRNP